MGATWLDRDGRTLTYLNTGIAVLEAAATVVCKTANLKNKTPICCIKTSKQNKNA